MRTYVYVDAFNLYYGCLKGRPHKWLDLRALCRHQLQPHHVIERIKYFTAHVSARDDPDRPNQQLLYLRALQTLPEVRIFLGKFQTHVRRMPEVVAPGAKQTYANVIWTSEKGSDVNLATHLVSDAYERRFEAAVVIRRFGSPNAGEARFAEPWSSRRHPEPSGPGIALTGPRRHVLRTH